MSGERVILLTSAGSGVGSAVQEAAVASPSEYRIVGTSSIPTEMRTGERALRCPVTAQREAFQQGILQLAASLGNCLVVPGRDEDADALAEIAPPLDAHGATLASGPAWAVSAAYDKAATPWLLASSSLPVAVAADNLTDALDVASTHGWPLVVKPRRGNSSRGIRIVKSEAELRACFRQGTDIAQEFVPVGPQDRRSWDGRFQGGQDGEYSLQILLGRGNEEIGHFCSRNILADGVPRLVETIDDGQVSDLIRQARHAFYSLHCWGAWNLQGRRGPDGAIRIFEVNARPTGITGLRARLGFNELDLLYESLLLRKVPERPEPPTAGLLIDTVSGDECGPVSTTQRLVPE
jgi:Carbamoyl-phosphate synthase L chain, ATP binding domain